jgi:hypothetical protein
MPGPMCHKCGCSDDWGSEQLGAVSNKTLAHALVEF